MCLKELPILLVNSGKSKTLDTNIKLECPDKFTGNSEERLKTRDNPAMTANVELKIKTLVCMCWATTRLH